MDVSSMFDSRKNGALIVRFATDMYKRTITVRIIYEKTIYGLKKTIYRLKKTIYGSKKTIWGWFLPRGDHLYLKLDIIRVNKFT